MTFHARSLLPFEFKHARMQLPSVFLIGDVERTWLARLLRTVYSESILTALRNRRNFDRKKNKIKSGAPFEKSYPLDEAARS